MSAITGIFYRDGHSVSPEQIKKMNSCLSHRGPDGSRVWYNGSVAFGHQMLYTTPESLKEELPFEDSDSGLVITSDARIDNRAELAPLLKLEDIQNVPDSYFILKAYQKWGEKCPEKLLGDFAFVIWDSVNEQLFCARDHMGVKQFYYHISENGFFFATEIKALLTISEIPNEVNDRMVAYHLIPIYGNKEITYYQGINHLPEAHWIIVNNENSFLKQYWILDPDKEVVLDSDEAYAIEFKKLFFEAVSCRLRSRYQLGFFLSGGLDSSSISCVAEQLLSKKNNQPLKTFSAIFPNVPESDESSYIHEVINNKNFDPHFILADSISPLANSEQIIWHVDAPIYGPNRFIHWNIYRAAKNKGVRVILDGIDGDSVVSHGYGRLTELAFSFHWITFLRELYKLSTISGLSKNKLCMQYLVTPAIPERFKTMFLRDIWFKFHGIDKDSMAYDYILNKDLKERFNLSKDYQMFMVEPKNNFRCERQIHHHKLQSGVLQYILEGLDLSAAAFQIEPRYPFFDKRLIEFCLALPSEQKLNEGWERIILRRAMEQILPKKIQWRQRKSLLGPNFKKSFFELEQENIKNIIFYENQLITDYVNLEEIKKIFERSIESESAKNSDTVKLWRLMILALWLRAFYNIPKNEKYYI